MRSFVNAWAQDRVNKIAEFNSFNVSGSMQLTRDAPPRIRCRQIGDNDLDGLIRLLTKAFPKRTRSYWAHAMQQLATRAKPESYPRFGYLLEIDSTLVGVILLIFSTQNAYGKTHVKCNVSTWYVDPRHRAYASLLVASSLRHKDVTYINISPADHTWAIIEAQGFTCYCSGEIIAIPALSPQVANTRVHTFDPSRDYGPALSEEERDILIAHVDYGCVAIIATEQGKANPFAFLPRRSFRGILPTLQLVYCRNVRDFARLAGPIGRTLIKRGSLFVRLDAEGPFPGLVGKYIRDHGRRYFRGHERPRIGDLSFSEGVLFGF
jgi:hypothetical protein